MKKKIKTGKQVGKKRNHIQKTRKMVYFYEYSKNLKLVNYI